MSKWKVVVTDSGYKHYDIEREVLAQADARLTVRQCKIEDEIIALAKDADGVIVRMQPFNRRVIEALPKCRVVGRYGIGFDNVDVETATRHGIAVGIVADYAVNEVAEQAIAMMFACARKTASHDKLVRSGVFDIGQKDPIHRIHGATLGLLGLGRIGLSLVRKLRGFEFRVIAADPVVTKEAAAEAGVALVDFDTLLRESDFLSIHAPLNDKTRHIIDESALRKMKPTAVLVNTSRGGLIDTKALHRALKEGWINSAGLDVHEQEPVPKDYILFEQENVVLADHAGWYSEESIAALQRGAAEAVAATLAGGWPKFLVNPAVKEIAAKKWKS